MSKSNKKSLRRSSLGWLLAFVIVLISQSSTALAKDDLVVKGVKDQLLISQYQNQKASELSHKEKSRAVNQIIQSSNNQDQIRVIVKLKTNFMPEGMLGSPSSVASQRNIISSMQGSVLNRMKGFKVQNVKQYKYIPYMALVTDANGLLALSNDPNVEMVYEDKINRPFLSDSVGIIGAANVWNSGYTGTGKVVAVLDTGVDKNHSFLTGKVVSEACYSTASNTPYSIESLCPGGSSNSTASNSGLNCTGIDGCFHGTHVAGIVAGKNGLNGTINGVAKDSNIIAMQVFSKFTENAQCGETAPCISAFDSDIIYGLQRVYDLRNDYQIASVNLSLGGGKYTNNCDTEKSAYKTAIDNLRSVGIATIVATGNESYTDGIASPACISTAISVGSTTKAGAVADYSNSSSLVNLLAPGSNITSSVPAGNYAIASGTSMAAPHVAGAWALIKDKSQNLSVGDILNLFQQTGVSVTDSKNNITKPRIDVASAINSIYKVTANAIGNGSGRVFTGSNGAINYSYPANNTGNADYITGSNVILYASANSNSIASWTSCPNGTVSGNNTTQATCEFTNLTSEKLVQAKFELKQYTIATSVTPVNSGNVICDPILVSHGGISNCVVTPNQYYTIQSVTGCDGNLSGNVYTTGNITSNCTVEATFNATSVNGQCGSANGVLTASAPNVNLCSAGNSTAVTTNVGNYTWSCDGIGLGTNANCSAPRGYIVTPSAGANGSISPNTAQTVQYNNTTQFTITPNSGYVASVGGTCGGTLSGSTYTTNPITQDCTVDVTFASNSVSGQCGSAHQQTFTSAPNSNLCSVGTPSTLQSELEVWTWTCNGLNGGSNANCYAFKRVFWFTINANGNGSGTIIYSDFSNQFNYPNENSKVVGFNYGTRVFRALADQGSTVSWDCQGGVTNGNGTTNATCTFENYNDDKTITVTFTKIAISLAKTGQKSCYSSNGTEIPCVNTGQDGEKRIGSSWPKPRFTDNNNGTITDNLTGLIWLKNADCFTDQTWKDALTAAANLASGQCGLSDGSQPGEWRIPNRKELLSLVDYSRNSPSLSDSHPFIMSQIDAYWTSSTREESPQGAWGVSLIDGSVSAYTKNGHNNLLPVRSGTFLPVTGQIKCYNELGSEIPCVNTKQDADNGTGIAWPNPRFTVGTGNESNCIIDNLTGLMWSKNSNITNGTKTWQEALDFIANMNSGTGLCGYNDWRLPNVNEIEGLWHTGKTNISQWLNEVGFDNVQIGFYWTSTTSALNPNSAWYFVSSYGGLETLPKSNSLYVLPVRGGKVDDLLNLYITKIGNGQGTVTSNIGAINYGDSRQDMFLKYNSVYLTVASASNSLFVGWGGDCSNCGTDTNCHVWMDTHKQCTAEFKQKPKLTVNKSGSGTGKVVSNNELINCGITCQADVTYGSSITLTATTTYSDSSLFIKWQNGTGSASSCNNSTGVCSFNITQDSSIEAVFNKGYFVIPSVIGNGVISLNHPLLVLEGGTAQITITPNSGYVASVGGTCGGTLSGSTYTTNPITQHCTVDVTFLPIINGVCGSASGQSFLVAPTSNLCSSGTATTATEHPTEPLWLWQCIGSNSGSTANCSATLQLISFSVKAEGDGRGLVTTPQHFAFKLEYPISYGDPNPRVLNSRYSENSEVQFIAQSATGSTVEWTTCENIGGNVSGNTTIKTCTFPNRTANKNPIVTFTANKYAVNGTLAAGQNASDGEISPSSMEVKHGSVASFVITPNTNNNKIIESVTTTCGGTLIGNIFKTSPITKSCTVEAKFKTKETLKPDILVSADTLNFGEIIVDQTAERSIIIKNTGAANLIIGNITKTEENNFAIKSDFCSGKTITPGNICTFKVAFTPKSTNNSNANITIPHNVENMTSKTINVSGQTHYEILLRLRRDSL